MLMQRIITQVTMEELQLLHEAAERTKRSRAEIIREAIDRYLVDGVVGGEA